MAQWDEQSSVLETSVSASTTPERRSLCDTVEESPSRPALKRIVLATDFSGNSLRALPLLSAMVRSCGIELYLVHLITPRAYKSIPCDSISWGIGELIDNANIKMAELMRSEMLTGIPIAGTTIAQGTAKDLRKVILDHQADLLALGIHGSRGFSDFRLGSFTADVLHDPPCPLLLF